MHANLPAGIFCFVVLALWITPGAAQDGWIASNAGHSATANDGNGRELSIICEEGGHLLLNYSFPIDELASELENVDEQYLLLMIEQREGDAIQSRHIDAFYANSDDIVRIGSAETDEVAEFARNISRAKGSVLVGITPGPPSLDFLLYNSVRYSTTGARSAMRAVLAACDIGD